MTLQQVAQNTIKRLQSQNENWTPEVYTKYFCIEAKLAGLSLDDCDNTNDFLSLLDTKASEEGVYKDDVSSIANNLIPSDFSEYEEEYQTIASLLIASLAPSVGDQMPTELIELCKAIIQSPTEIATTFKHKIHNSIALRKNIDKKSVKRMLSTQDKLIADTLLNILNALWHSNYYNKDFSLIEKGINVVLARLASSSSTDNHTQLLRLISTLNNKITALELPQHSINDSIKDRQIQYDTELEEEILTEPYGPKMLSILLDKYEARYKRHNNEYSIVMFSLDFFKKSHTTSASADQEMINRQFENILKKITREDDVIGYYTDEDLMAILNQTDINGAKKFAHKIRRDVKKTNFQYLSETITIDVSIAVVQRSDYSSLATLKESAHKKLYLSKHQGANRIYI